MKVEALTVSIDNKGDEFLFHIEGEYDYRYTDMSMRDTITDTVRRVLKTRGKKFRLYKVVSFLDLAGRMIKICIALIKIENIYNFETRSPQKYC